MHDLIEEWECLAPNEEDWHFLGFPAEEWPGKRACRDTLEEAHRLLSGGTELSPHAMVDLEIWREGG